MESLPRKGSIVYNIKFGDEKARDRTLNRWKFMNRFVIVPLGRMRLFPILFLKNTFVVVSVIGRKTGTRRYAGISLRKLDEGMFLFLARGMKTQWFTNHLANPDLSSIYYGFKKYRVEFELLHNIDKLRIMGKYVVRYPKWAKLGIGWNKEKDDPRGELLREYLSKIEIVKISMV